MSACTSIAPAASRAPATAARCSCRTTTRALVQQDRCPMASTCATSASIGSRISSGRSGSGSSSSPGSRTSSRRSARSTPSPTTCPTRLTTFLGREHEIAEVARPAGAQPAADADRPGRHRQDAAQPRGRRPRAGTPSRRRLLRRAGVHHASRSWCPPPSPRRWACRIAAGAAPVERLADAIGEKRMLLVLDNFEQVVGCRAGHRRPAGRLPRT